MEEPNYKLEFVENTYAECCGNVIRIHKDLPMYSPELYRKALNHEIGHLNKTFLEDLIWDLKDLLDIKTHFKALKFYLKHPNIIKHMIYPIHYNEIGRNIEVNYVLLFTYFVYFILIFAFLVIM